MIGFAAEMASNISIKDGYWSIYEWRLVWGDFCSMFPLYFNSFILHMFKLKSFGCVLADITSAGKCKLDRGLLSIKE